MATCAPDEWALISGPEGCHDSAGLCPPPGGGRIPNPRRPFCGSAPPLATPRLTIALGVLLSLLQIPEEWRNSSFSGFLM